MNEDDIDDVSKIATRSFDLYLVLIDAINDLKDSHQLTRGEILLAILNLITTFRDNIDCPDDRADYHEYAINLFHFVMEDNDETGTAKTMQQIYDHLDSKRQK